MRTLVGAAVLSLATCIGIVSSVPVFPYAYNASGTGCNRQWVQWVTNGDSKVSFWDNTAQVARERKNPTPGDEHP